MMIGELDTTTWWIHFFAFLSILAGSGFSFLAQKNSKAANKAVNSHTVESNSPTLYELNETLCELAYQNRSYIIKHEGDLSKISEQVKQLDDQLVELQTCVTSLQQ